MKTKIFLFTFFFIALCTKAAVTMPVDYTSFFANSAVNANTTDLEVGSTAAVNTWYLVGTANGSSPTINNSLLSYSNYVDNTNGRKIVLSSGVSAVRTSFFQLTPNATDLPGGRTYYLSFLINVTSAPSAAYVVLSNFINGITSGGSRGRIQIKANATTNATGFYLQPVITNAGVATASISYNSPHLIVLKYDITTASTVTGSTSNTDGAATVTIFVDPTIGNAEPSSTATVTQTGVANLECIKSLVLSQQPGLGAEISGLRFSNAWADVCKASSAPRLTTPTVSTVTSVTSTGFTANWTPVANALSYNVTVYKNGVFFSTTNAGQSATSVAITGLSNSLAYTYTVTAKGDGTNYSNSDPSATQTVILPINYTAFFAASAINNAGTTLETGNAAAVGTWAVGTTNGGANPDIQTSTLSYSNYIDNNGGKYILLPSSASANRNSLFYLTSSASDLTSGPYYLSFLLNVSAVSGNSLNLISFANTNTGGLRGRVNINPVNSGFQLGASNSGSSTYYSTTLSFGTTYLVVLKQEITLASATSGNATTSIFVNPALDVNEPTANAIKLETGAASLDCIRAISVNPQSGLGAEIAGLRFSTNWSYVTSSSTVTNIGEINDAELKVVNKTVIAPETGSFEVYNVQGVRLISADNQKEVQLSLMKGVYIVKFTNASGKNTIRKIILR